MHPDCSILSCCINLGITFWTSDIDLGISIGLACTLLISPLVWPYDMSCTSVLISTSNTSLVLDHHPMDLFMQFGYLPTFPTMMACPLWCWLLGVIPVSWRVIVAPSVSHSHLQILWCQTGCIWSCITILLYWITHTRLLSIFLSCSSSWCCAQFYNTIQ